MIKLRRLSPGDRVALVAPASSFAAEEVGGGVAELQRLGLEAVYDDSLFARDRFVAGSAEGRAQAIHRAWADPSIAALVCMRGGYGSAQVLPLLNPALMRESRKALIGYSDITALLAFYLQHGLKGVCAAQQRPRAGRLTAEQEAAFRQTLLTTKDGEQFAGLFRREEGEQLVLADPTGREFTVKKSDVAERKESELSIMPDSFGENIPERDFYHLLAFLLSKRLAN